MLTNTPRNQSEPQDGQAKKTYSAPTLTQYGDIQQITQGAGGPTVDIDFTNTRSQGT